MRKYTSVRIVQLIGLAIVLAILVVLINVGYDFAWTGFAAYQPTLVGGVAIERSKTLWDWLQLFSIPAALAFGIIGFNRLQRQENRRRDESQVKEQRKIEKIRLEEEIILAT